MRRRILIIEDEPGIGMAVKDELQFEGFEVQLLENGSEGFEAILQERPDLVVLDLMLPGKNGFEICSEIRRRGIETPVVMLTARTQEADRVRGLDLGADDYVVKPFSLTELVARIRAVLRRYDRNSVGMPEGSQTFQVGQLSVDLKRQTVFRGEEDINLTRKEFQLLELLLRRRGEVISRDEFLDAIWGEDVYVTHRTIDTHMATLRKKIEDDPAHPVYILSVRSVGYRFNENLTVS
ncbi:response regulator transcription factor [Acidobacteria bacterium AH-259-O06]|nr:response regulator transcription factor [Acidobacteria bacterium AH-259-O06]